MRLLYDAVVLLLIAAFFYITDPNKCAKGNLLLFVHQIISSFAYFGWLSANVYTLLLFVVAVLVCCVCWMFNKNRCVVTQISNKLCGRPKNAMYHDIWSMLGFKHKKWWTNTVYPFYTIITVAFAVYKLTNRKKFNLDHKI